MSEHPDTKREDRPGLDREINPCRHYDPINLIRGCKAGRIAPMDCFRCPLYDPEIARDDRQ